MFARLFKNPYHAADGTFTSKDKDADGKPSAGSKEAASILRSVEPSSGAQKVFKPKGEEDVKSKYLGVIEGLNASLLKDGYALEDKPTGTSTGFDRTYLKDGAGYSVSGRGRPVQSNALSTSFSNNRTEYVLNVRMVGKVKKMYTHLFKANPYHDQAGRFTEKGKATFASIGGVFDRQKSRLKEKDAPTSGNSQRDLDAMAARGLKTNFTADQWMAATKGKMRVRDLVDSLVGKDGGKLSGTLSLDKTTAKIELRDQQAHGALFKVMKKTISFGKLEATHLLMRVDKANTGAGAVKAMYRELLPLYEKAGIKKIKLAANLEAGAHAWAKYGFVADDPGQYARDFKSGMDSLFRRTKLSGEQKKELASVHSLIKMVEDHKYNTHILSDVKPKYLDRLLNAGLPASQHRTMVKRMADGLEWLGSLDLKDDRQVGRLKKYIGK